MKVWGVTDIGLVRKENQDAFLLREQTASGHTVCVVCDGMGGTKSGNVASQLAADVFTQEVKRSYKPDMEQDALDRMLRSAVKLANFTVFDQSQQFEEFYGMGTTMVAVLICGKNATFINVGDSRGYHIDRDGISQITVDHSLVQLMVDRGELTPEQAKTYPGKNLITRAIGTESQVSCDIFYKKLERGDCLLLCSDGLCNMVEEQEILFEVVHGVDKGKCCQRLLEIAKKRGAPDNVTSVLVVI